MPTLPFEPEPEEALRKRFSAALTPVYDPARILSGRMTRPGILRRHVFDWEDGWRAIVSIDKERGKLPILHMSFSSFKKIVEPKADRHQEFMATMIAECHNRAKKLSGAKLEYAKVEFSGVAIHLAYPAEQVAR